MTFSADAVFIEMCDIFMHDRKFEFEFYEKKKEDDNSLGQTCKTIKVNLIFDDSIND